MSNVGGCSFGVLMWANSLMEAFFFDGGSLGRITCPRKEVVMEMVIGIVQKLGMLMEVAIMVQLMVKGQMWEMVVELTEGVL